MITRRTLLTTAAAGSAIAIGDPALAAPLKPPRRSRDRLTNLSHLTFLLAEVPLPVIDGHTTYEHAERPTALAPWTYADRLVDGSYRRIGGGSQDPETGHWTQGAYNADDISRAAVVYLRAFAAFGDHEDLEKARGLLRSLTFLQVAEGENVGNVVLWQQDDGTLNRSAEPVELPDPSDSDESYWLARTVWALGEGVEVFDREDHEFTAFLRDRLHLCLDALDRASLSRYGEWAVADGVEVPAWLITGGADATGEALLGLAAHLRATPADARAREALTRYAEAVTAMSSGAAGEWPYGAIMPWDESQSLWHAWGGLAPAGLAATHRITGDGAALEAAAVDVGVFTPQLLASGGPYNAWSPKPGEAQIAYGVQSRVESLLTVAEATGGDGLRRLAGITAGWFFGANPAGEPVYDVSSGTTVDGIETDGRLNRNSGAESTIHALLTMIDLDLHPDVAALATSLRGIVRVEGQVWLEAEGSAMAGDATVVTPPSAWTGESNWSGSYIAASPGSVVTMDLTSLPETTAGAFSPAVVQPVIHRFAEEAGMSYWTAIDTVGRRTDLGQLPLGGAGSPGITAWDGLLKPYPLPVALPNGAVALEVRSEGRLELDAVVLLPAVSAAVYDSAEGDVVLRVNATSQSVRCDVRPGETGSSWTHEGTGRRPVNRGRRQIPAGAFSITHR